MKKLACYAVGFALVLLGFTCFGQDSVFVYQQNSQIRIQNLDPNPLFLTPGAIDFRLSGNNFILKNGITRQEFNIGTYDEVFNSDSVGFTDNDDLVDYLTQVLNIATRDVFINDQTTNPFHYYLMREEKTDITLTSNVLASSNTVTVSSGHGFTAEGEFICIMEDCAFEQAEVTSANGDVIALATPVFNNYTTDATVIRGIIEMNADASASDSMYQFNLRDCTIPIDIQYVIILLQDNLEGDDSKFGGIAELSKGVYFYRQNSTYTGYGNYKTNSDFRAYGIKPEYDDKAGGGNYSMNAEIDVKEKYGVVLRMNPRDGDKFKAIVRDDLSDLVKFRVALLGQYTSGE